MQWLMLQQNEPEDFVIATGISETVRTFIEKSAKQLNWNLSINEPAIIWEGERTNEVGRRSDTKEIVIRIDKKYFRPTEVDILIGDSSKALKKLNWKPKINLDQLIEEMISVDLKEAKEEYELMRIKNIAD